MWGVFLKKTRDLYPLRILPTLIGIVVCASGLLIYPSYTSAGIRNGLRLLGENIIPSLFPFMVLSTYIAQSSATELMSKLLHKPASIIWGVNGNGLIAVILGLIGGYPVGAKTVAEFYTDSKVSQQEASRLMSWCVNPGPAFVITAVGTFMLRNTASGIILYASSVISSLCIGVFTRFFNNTEVLKKPQNTTGRNHGNLLIKSVASGSEGMISMCGWVLTFSAVTELLNATISTDGLRLFLQCIAEVTTGCGICTKNALPLPALSAIISFGGFAVIAQVSPYLAKCGVSVKQFVCWRATSAALSAFVCSVLLRIFPQTASAFAVQGTHTPVPALSNGIYVALILLLTCLVFIFEVDNKRKIC